MERKLWFGECNLMCHNNSLFLSAQTNRIEWIDTAKGFCIILVVIQHISNYVVIDYFMEEDFRTFRMPLYFFLSGLFFKTYEGFVGFAVRKTNKLLIPYVFFYVVFSIVIPVVLYRLFGYKISGFLDYGFDGIKYIFSERPVYNNFIWFLFCLFEVNILFYISKLISDRFNRSTLILVFFTCLCGMFGLLLDWFSKRLPYFLDSAFSALPFFAFGYFINRFTRFLDNDRNRKTDVLSCVFIVAVFILIHFFNKGNLQLFQNTIGTGFMAYLQVYPYGILGTLSVLFIARFLGSVPVISYLGKYSIIVLCTHGFVYRLIGDLILRGNIIDKTCFFVVLILLTIFVEIGVIWIFKNYFGYFTAQKDLIKVSSFVKHENIIK